MTHQILRQFFDVTFTGSEAEGVTLQKHLYEISQNLLPQVITQVLDRYAAADIHLHLHRLEIDLGTLSMSSIADTLPAKLARVMDTQLHAQITDSGNFKQSDTPTYTWSLLAEYLRRGYLPWHFRLESGQNLAKVLSGKLFEGKGGEDALLRVLSESSTARERLATQFPASFLVRLLAHISPGISKQVQAMLDVLQKKLSQDIGLRTQVEQILWQNAFLQAAKNDVASEQMLSVRLLDALRKIYLPTDVLSALATTVGISTHAESTTTPSTVTPSAAPKKNASSPPPDPDDAIYIENAGLILLHPYLSGLFEILGILHDDGTISDMPTALAILHFLATGLEAAEEHELVLPKLLCGLPPEALPGTPHQLSIEEKAEAQALLEAVVKHWGALRNTTPDGLRGNFLCRAGRLSPREDNEWRLLVERKTHDILLDRLPWGIGMVKLPWMTQMLWVDWN